MKRIDYRQAYKYHANQDKNRDESNIFRKKVIVKNSFKSRLRLNENYRSSEYAKLIIELIFKTLHNSEFEPMYEKVLIKKNTSETLVLVVKDYAVLNIAIDAKNQAFICLGYSLVDTTPMRSNIGFGSDFYYSYSFTYRHSIADSHHLEDLSFNDFINTKDKKFSVYNEEKLKLFYRRLILIRDNFNKSTLDEINDIEELV